MTGSPQARIIAVKQIRRYGGVSGENKEIITKGSLRIQTN